MIGKIAIPRDWDSACPRGDLQWFGSKKATTIIDYKKRRSMDVPRAHDGVGFDLAPTADYYGHFGPARDYHLFSTDQRAKQLITLQAEYNHISISPQGTYLFARFPDADGLFNRALEKFDFWPPSKNHLISTATGEILATLPADNDDWVREPIFSMDNVFLFAFDRRRASLAVWTLPVQNRIWLKTGLLVTLILLAGGGVYKSFRMAR